jgi:hypothetical protein
MQTNISPQEQLLPAIHEQTSAGEVNGPAVGKNSAESSGSRTIRSTPNALPEDAASTAKELNHVNLELQTTPEPGKATPPISADRPKKQKQSRVKKSAAESLNNGLNEEQKLTVDRLLKEIPEAFKGCATRRRKLGECLSELQEVFAKAGKNGRFHTCLRQLHIQKSTAYDLIGRYKRINNISPPILEAADELGIDLGAPKMYSRFEELHPPEGLDLAKAKELLAQLTKKPKPVVTPKFGPGITQEENQMFKVLDALRRSMGDFTHKEKKELLPEVLNLYAHYYLQNKEQMSIKVVPTKAEDDWVLLPSKGKSTEEATCTKKL